MQVGARRRDASGVDVPAEEKHSSHGRGAARRFGFHVDSLFQEIVFVMYTDVMRAAYNSVLINNRETMRRQAFIPSVFPPRDTTPARRGAASRFAVADRKILCAPSLPCLLITFTWLVLPAECCSIPQVPRHKTWRIIFDDKHTHEAPRAARSRAALETRQQILIRLYIAVSNLSWTSKRAYRNLLLSIYLNTTRD